MWKSWSDEQKEQRKREIFELAAAYTYFTQYTDEYRHELASSYGGFELTDQAQTDLLRSALTEIVTVSFRSFSPKRVINSFCCLDSWSENSERRFQLDSHKFPDQMHGSIISLDVDCRFCYDIACVYEQGGDDY